MPSCLAQIRRAFGLLNVHDRRRWAALVPVAIASGALEALGAAVVFLLVRLLTGPEDPRALPSAVRPFVEGREVPAAFLWVSGAVLVLYVARNALLVWVSYVQERVIQESSERLASGLLARYLSAPYAFHFGRSPASLIHAIDESVSVVVEMVLASCVHLASEGLIVAGLLAVLAIMTPLPALAAVVTTALLVAVPLALTRRRYARWGSAEEALHDRLLADLHQSLDAVKDILVAGRQDYFAHRYSRDRHELVGVKVRRLTATSAIRLLVETAFISSMFVAVAALALMGRADADMVATLGLFAYAGFRMVPSVNRIMLNVNLLRYGSAYVEPLVADWERLTVGRPPTAPPWPPLTRDLVLERVSYGYGGGRAPALDGVNLRIARGESVGIVGATGAGKSTLVDVVLGLLTPTSGRVLVDGRDVRDGVRAWQARIGYVAQDVVIVDDTLRRNVAFGVDDGAIDEDRLRHVVSAACLDSLVARLPRGLDTVLGARGIRLSGGERQRVAIARALYRNPAVLVFDEATSALDSQTEREIAAAIDAVRVDRTVIVIAHRLTTVRHCDRLVVLSEGRIVADGPYERLLEESPAFRVLAADLPAFVGVSEGQA